MLLILLFLASIATVPNVLARSGSQTASTAAQFETVFDAFTDSKPDPNAWLKQPSPWASQLTRLFFHALDDEEQARSLTAQRLGQCEPVISGEMRGFFNLGTELQAIMIRADIRTNFESVVLPQFSHALKRCRAHAVLIPIIETARRRHGLEESFAVILPHVSVFRPPPLTILDTTWIYYKAVRDIYRLGLCDGFTPALEDIVWLETEIRTHQMSLKDLVWFETKFSTSSSMRRKLEVWIRYVESLARANRLLLAYERAKMSADGSAQIPGQLRIFCQQRSIKNQDKH